MFRLPAVLAGFGHHTTLGPVGLVFALLTAGLRSGGTAAGRNHTFSVFGWSKKVHSLKSEKSEEKAATFKASHRI
jgi:hypothetical protein